MKAVNLMNPKDDITVLDEPSVDASVHCINCQYGQMTTIEEELDEDALDRLCADKNYRRGTLDRKWASKLRTCRFSRSVVVCLREHDDGVSNVLYTPRSTCPFAAKREGSELSSLSREEMKIQNNIKNAMRISGLVINE